MPSNVSSSVSQSGRAGRGLTAATRTASTAKQPSISSEMRQSGRLTALADKERDLDNRIKDIQGRFNVASQEANLSRMEAELAEIRCQIADCRVKHLANMDTARKAFVNNKIGLHAAAQAKQAEAQAMRDALGTAPMQPQMAPKSPAPATRRSSSARQLKGSEVKARLAPSEHKTPSSTQSPTRKANKSGARPNALYAMATAMGMTGRLAAQIGSK